VADIAAPDIAALEAAADEPSPEDAAIARDELQRVEMAIAALHLRLKLSRGRITRMS
jgi:hypothetical protein